MALREGRVYVPRLVRVPAGEAEVAPLNPQGTVSITGGTGALGARACVASGADARCAPPVAGEPSW